MTVDAIYSIIHCNVIWLALNMPEWDKLVVAALGDLLQITDFQTYLSQQVLNVYYYRVTSITGLDGGYLEAIGDWFKDNVLAAVVNVQVDGLLHVTRDIRNLSNGVDLYTDSEVIPGAGDVSATSFSPSYVSLGFLLRRESLTTRNGYKRIAGVPEQNITGNQWDGPTDVLSDIEIALAMDVVIGLATIAEPVIVKRPIDVPVGEYEYSSVGSASFRGLGTQNSRKPGRGV